MSYHNGLFSWNARPHAEYTLTLLNFMLPKIHNMKKYVMSIVSSLVHV